MNTIMLKTMNKKKTAAETLGSRLQGLLDDYGLSAERLAQLSGMTGVSIRSILKDESTPYRSTVDKIAKALGTTYEYLINGVGEPLPKGKKNLTDETPDMWKDEAWEVAKDQLKTKDSQLQEKDTILKMLAVSFDRVTKMMQDSGMSFLHPVAKTGT